MCRILENLEKTFFLRKKIHLQFSKSGVFWGKKMFRKFLETSVIISLYGGDSRYFGKKISKTFLSGKKSNFNFQNRGFCEKKKIKISPCRRHFFEPTSEAKCPRLVLHVLCLSRVHLSRVK